MSNQRNLPSLRTFLAAIALSLPCLPQALAASHVKCDVDEDGPFCAIDLGSDCQGHTACSVSFGGNHEVLSTSKGGLNVEMREGRGKAGDAIADGERLPMNNEVCVDSGLEITQVGYQPAKENARWTSYNGGGVIGGYKDKLSAKEAEDIPLHFPYQPGAKLQSQCVKMEVEDPSETRYTILYVRVAMKTLDKSRVKFMKQLMTDAGKDLAAQLDHSKHVSEHYEKILASSDPNLAPLIESYKAAVDEAHHGLEHLQLFWESRKPVTGPNIADNMRAVYIAGEMLISRLQGTAGISVGYIVHLRRFMAATNQGFGFNPADTSDVIGEEPSVGSLLAMRDPLAINATEAGKAANYPGKAYYKTLIGNYSRALGSLGDSLSKISADLSNVDGYAMDGDTYLRALDAYAACVDLTHNLPETKKSDGSPSDYYPFLHVVKPFCENLESAFSISVPDQSPEAAHALVQAGLSSLDSHRKLEPLFEILAMALSNAASMPSLKWSGTGYQAVAGLSDFVTNRVIKDGREGGDSSVIDHMGELEKRWTSPELQTLLSQIQARSGSDASAENIRILITDARREIVAAYSGAAAAMPLPSGFESN